MKYLVLIAVVGLVLWMLRSRSSGSTGSAKAGTAPPPKPAATGGVQPMIRCAHCGVHLPRGDAVAGAAGSYCSEAHRLAHGEPR